MLSHNYFFYANELSLMIAQAFSLITLIDLLIRLFLPFNQYSFDIIFHNVKVIIYYLKSVT
jgi:hypothetical protein